MQCTSSQPGYRVGPRLEGRRVVMARAGWLLLLTLTLTLFGLGIAPFAHELQTVCASGCQAAQLSPAAAATLHAAGVSLHVYAVAYIALEAVSVLTFGTVGFLLLRARAHDLLGILGATALLLSGGVIFSETVTALVLSQPGWGWSVTALSFLGSAALLPFFSVFPTGEWIPPWTRWTALAWVGLCALGYFTPATFPLNQRPTNPSHLFPILALGFVASVLVAQGDRYRRAASDAERQQVKWLALGLAIGFGGLFLSVFVVEPRVRTGAPAALMLRFLGLADGSFFLLAIPLAIAIAIIRHRLWDIDIILSRTLVYGTLTAAIVGLYILIVGYLGTLFRRDANLLISLVATGVVAMLFAPLRSWLQHGVNHLLYGERDTPYLVLARLGHRLETTLAPDTVLPTITTTIRETLKLPYAAIELPQDGELRVAAATGAPPPHLLRIPMTYQGEPVGVLVLGARAGEAFGRADRQLLGDLASQAGVAIHGLRLLADLQASRERLVLAREEERRRLRRDLHDELAPTLAALGLTAATVGELIGANPARARAVNQQLQLALRSTVADVRRLVYDLRPPALDELGLVEAVRERAAPHGFAVVVPRPLPSLPAAVEVAAYRIAQEAMANVSRHAQTTSCEVRLAHNAGWLEVEVVDDGIGLPERYAAGIGLRSMRERAAELGGECTIARHAQGTRVHARLPLGGGDVDGR